jgi:hypothetical protein
MFKKGAVVISLTWILTVIIGTFFLYFAYHLVSNYQDIEEEKYYLNLQFTLQDVFKKIGEGTGVETSSVQPLKYIFKDKDIGLQCVDGQFPIFLVDGRPQKANSFVEQYPFTMIGISSKSIEQTYIATEKFFFPFEVTSMMVLISKKNYVIFNESIWFSHFKSKLYDFSAYKNLSFQVEDLSQSGKISQVLSDLSKNSPSSITIVSTPGLNIDPLELDKYDIPIYVIELTINEDRFVQNYDDFEYWYGNISYTQSNVEDFSPMVFNYTDFNKELSLPVLALFSTPESFSCLMYSIEQQTRALYSFYRIKTEEILKSNDLSQFCDSKIPTDGIEYIYKNESDALEEIAQSDTFKNLDDLKVSIGKLWRANLALKTNKCFPIY